MRHDQQERYFPPPIVFLPLYLSFSTNFDPSLLLSSPLLPSPPYSSSPLLPFLPQRIHLDILIGEHAVNYPEVAAKEKLSELQLRVRQLLDQIDQITKEQAYQRVSESLTTLLKMGRYYNATMCHYWDMSVK